MRIALVSHHAVQVGGVERYLRTIAPALRRAGHDVCCWTERAPDGGEALFEAGDGITIFSAAENAESPFDELRRWAPDVLYAQGVASIDYERQLLSIATGVFFAHSYYGTCVSGAKRHRQPDRCCTQRFGTGCFFSYYPRRCGGLNPATFVRQFTLQRERLRLLPDYDRVLVASHHMAAEYASHGLGQKVAVVDLPVEPSPAFPDSSRPDHLSRLLYMGRLEETKGAHLALESGALVAAASSRPVHLKLVGEGGLRAALAERAARLMAQQPNFTVSLTGWLARDQSADALAWADVLLMPSCWPEPFGMVGVEAGLQGVPVVAFAVGGIAEWLTDGVNGRLVRANPPDARRFAQAIVACLDDAHGPWQTAEERGRLAARFSVDRHRRQLEAVLAEAIDRRSGECQWA